ncbi:MAG: peptidase [Cycloclasticus sp. symbiont of Poecilosclerida sp. M]|nr:MAG: peptidase [Cycloclasticus sp. symbiont of Poecilosclerida sp. M]
MQELKNVQYQTPLTVYSQEGLLISQFGEQKRIPIEYADVPEGQINAFLAAEDNRFFQHGGVDYIGLTRAAIQLLLTGKKKQGGSTITMQVARNFFLSNKKTYTRKLREILLSYIIESELSKQEIFSLYLNKIFLGHRSYGIAAAAQIYYGARLSDLSLAQQAMIAGLPKAPSAYNPITNPERALIRRDHILNRMFSLDYITQEQLDIALAESISAEISAASIDVQAPYIAEMVRSELYKTYGDEIYTSGMHVYTTIKSSQQRAANHAAREALHQYDKRHGYRGALGHVKNLASLTTEEIASSLAEYKKIGDTVPAIVMQLGEENISVQTRGSEKQVISWDGLSWAKTYISENRYGVNPKKPSDILKLGDIIRIRIKHNASKGSDADSNQKTVEPLVKPQLELAQVPQAAGAIVAMDPKNGRVTALVGGYDFYESKFNRAYQTKRQPGSGFKPILYTAALTKGYTTATLINDAPVVFDDAGLEEQWRPENYSGKFYGPTRLREALVNSRNLVSIRILRDLGVRYVSNFAANFGFNPAALPKNLSLALGSSSASPYQMATVYSVFANGGFQVEPHFIDRIVSPSGDTLFKASHPIVCTDCLPEELAFADTVQTIPLPTTEGVALFENSPMSDAVTEQVPAKRVLSPQVNFLINNLLRDVVNRGTGRKALSLGRTDLAGKTGTTNDQKDAWFNGFNPNLVAIAWVGFDDSRSLGDFETGGKAALPMWMSFMGKALKGSPDIALQQPEEIVSILIDKETGLMSGPSNEDAVFEFFREENVPQAQANIPTPDGMLGEPEQKTIEELF